MKNLKLLILAALISQQTIAQSDKYVKMMEKTLAAMDTARTYGSFLTIGGVFERIGNTEKNQWLPFYHAAYAYTIASHLQQDTDKKDEYLDKAQQVIDRALPAKPEEEAEIYLLKSFILSARIPVSPMTRGMKYGPESGAMLEAAYPLDKENPRYYYLKGSSAFYTPEMFGGGKDKALPHLEKAQEKYKTFKPLSSIHPNWGEKHALQMIEKCNEATK